MPVTKSLDRLELVKILAENGFGDSIILRHEAAKKILTEQRKRLIEEIKNKPKPESIRDLARKLDRDPAAVQRDLNLLYKYNLIEYIKEGNKKQPRLKHQHIFIEPII